MKNQPRFNKLFPFGLCMFLGLSVKNEKGDYLQTEKCVPEQLGIWRSIQNEDWAMPEHMSG